MIEIQSAPQAVGIADDSQLTSHADDFLVRDGQMLVLRGYDLYLLSQVAAESMSAAWEGIGYSALRTRLLEIFGEPLGVSVDVQLQRILEPLLLEGLMTVDATRVEQ
ncbi:hypothetical protein [Demequina sediminicola]|uniref:hypothetical protein n=1 Tax=Demequina sediminicola TaxID=1095026 RepID=UPI00078141EA|nr:hypothetical protein [Demequina sediminicola]